MQVRGLESSRNFLGERLNGMPGFECKMPRGALYAYPSCAGLIGKERPDGTRIENDSDVVDFLLEEAGVSVMPGSVFGRSPFVRFSFAVDDKVLEIACRQISEACARLG